MAAGALVRTAALTALVTACLTGCGAAARGTDPAARDLGPVRPAAGGAELVVDTQPLEAPVLVDPVPGDLLPTELWYSPPDPGLASGRATLYGDPALADTLDGPVLLVGTSAGSAAIAGPGHDAPAEQVDLGGRTGRVVRDADRTWVLVEGNDSVEFVVGRGIGEDELVAAARGADFGSATATLGPDAVPPGLEPLVAGSPPDGPGAGPGEHVFLVGDSTWISVVAVRADPRLAALWGFWVDDATGTPVRGRPGSAGVLRGTQLGGPEAPGRVWAEDGMVLAAVATLDLAGEAGGLLDRVVSGLRVATWAEFEAAREEILERPPTREEVPTLRPDSGFVSGVDGGVRWSFELYPNPCPGMEDWSATYVDLTSGGGGGGSVLPPPLGEVAVHVGGSIVGGVAPPGTARVTVTGPDGSTREAVLSDVGPRPGERVWGAFLPDVTSASTSPTPPYVFWSVTATAYDAAGTVLHSRTV
ncbi:MULTISPECIES: hypothetical protein [unclassified Blastococcus]